MNDIAKVDWDMVPVEPDEDFDAEENQKTIQSIIRDTNKLRAKKKREWRDKARERTSAVARYVKSDTDKNPKKYFGKKFLTYLRGREIIDEIKDAKKKQERKDRKKKV